MALQALLCLGGLAGAGAAGYSPMLTRGHVCARPVRAAAWFGSQPPAPPAEALAPKLSFGERLVREAKRFPDLASEVANEITQITPERIQLIAAKGAGLVKGHPKAAMAAGGAAIVAAALARRRRARALASTPVVEQEVVSKAKPFVNENYVGSTNTPSTPPVDPKPVPKRRFRRPRVPLPPFQIKVGDKVIETDKATQVTANVSLDAEIEETRIHLKGATGGIISVTGLGGTEYKDAFVLSTTGDNPIPVSLKMGEKKVITIRYSPPEAGKQSQIVTFNMRRWSSSANLREISIAPCNASTPGIVLKPGSGEAVSGGEKFIVTLPEDVVSTDFLMYPETAGTLVSVGNSLYSGRPKRFMSQDTPIKISNLKLVPGPNNIKIDLVSEDRKKRQQISVKIVRKPRQLFFNSAAVMVPRPGKEAKGGEDAFVMWQGTGGASTQGQSSGQLLVDSGNGGSNGGSNGNDDVMPRKKSDGYVASLAQASVIAVSDGVSAWDAMGIDAGAYSKELMNEVTTVLNDNKAAFPIRAKDILRSAWSQTKNAGSATATLLALENTTLTAAIVGDSRFICLRDNKVYFVSPVQEMAFNTPFQLANPENNPEDLELQTPDDAKIVTLRDIRKGDIVILGTDGLFDNVFIDKIEDLTARVRRKSTNLDQFPQELAEALMAEAIANSKDTERDTPWAREARLEVLREVRAIRREEGPVALEYEIPKGGKPDDISIVVGVAV